MTCASLPPPFAYLSLARIVAAGNRWLREYASRPLASSLGMRSLRSAGVCLLALLACVTAVSIDHGMFLPLLSQIYVLV